MIFSFLWNLFNLYGYWTTATSLLGVFSFLGSDLWQVICPFICLGLDGLGFFVAYVTFTRLSKLPVPKILDRTLRTASLLVVVYAGVATAVNYMGPAYPEGSVEIPQQTGLKRWLMTPRHNETSLKELKKVEAAYKLLDTTGKKALERELKKLKKSHKLFKNYCLTETAKKIMGLTLADHGDLPIITAQGNGEGREVLHVKTGPTTITKREVVSEGESIQQPRKTKEKAVKHLTNPEPKTVATPIVVQTTTIVKESLLSKVVTVAALVGLALLIYWWLRPPRQDALRKRKQLKELLGVDPYNLEEHTQHTQPQPLKPKAQDFPNARKNVNPYVLYTTPVLSPTKEYHEYCSKMHEDYVNGISRPEKSCLRVQLKPIANLDLPDIFLEPGIRPPECLEVGLYRQQPNARVIAQLEKERQAYQDRYNKRRQAQAEASKARSQNQEIPPPPKNNLAEWEERREGVLKRKEHQDRYNKRRQAQQKRSAKRKKNRQAATPKTKNNLDKWRKRQEGVMQRKEQSELEENTSNGGVPHDGGDTPKESGTIRCVNSGNVPPKESRVSSLLGSGAIAAVSELLKAKDKTDTVTETVTRKVLQNVTKWVEKSRIVNRPKVIYENNVGSRVVGIGVGGAAVLGSCVRTIGNFLTGCSTSKTDEQAVAEVLTGAAGGFAAAAGIAAAPAAFGTVTAAAGGAVAGAIAPQGAAECLGEVFNDENFAENFKKKWMTKTEKDNLVIEYWKDKVTTKEWVTKKVEESREVVIPAQETWGTLAKSGISSVASSLGTSIVCDMVECGLKKEYARNVGGKTEELTYGQKLKKRARNYDKKVVGAVASWGAGVTTAYYLSKHIKSLEPGSIKSMVVTVGTKMIVNSIVSRSAQYSYAKIKRVVLLGRGTQP